MVRDCSEFPRPALSFMNEFSVPKAAPEDSIAPIEARFWAMHKASRMEPPPASAERKDALRALRGVIVAHAAEFSGTIARDFGWRSHDETWMAEVVPALTLIRDALVNVDRWMRPEPRGTSVVFWPARNKVVWQPKGVVLIISPWNYPLQLTAGALAAALAAGNRVIIKPSETTPTTASALKRHLEGALGPDRVTVATGGADTAEALCALPFDHILFTGSTAVGKRVMAAAAQNLTPVTLELGGKSPAIVHGDFDHAVAAKRIARGKLLNAGQTCIAPDYVLVQNGQLDTFVRAFQDAAAQFYPRLVDNADYTSIVNQRHYDRLMHLAADARTRGARLFITDPARELAGVEIGAPAARKIAPLVLTGVNDDMAIMQEEIFGPLLPVIGYDALEDAIAFVNARPRPLALYYFDGNSSRVEQVMQRTVSGGVSVNDTVLHFAQEGLPFGGVGPSGMGAYHGREGFRTFSHGKGVFLQSRWTLTGLIAPPYGPRFRRAIRFAVRRNGG